MKSMVGLKGILFAGALVVLLVTAAYAYATDNQPADDNAVTMGTVVVTGTRTQEQIGKVPANVTVITHEEIENSNAKDVPDLLQTQVGVNVQDLLGNGKDVNVGLRGFGETGPYNTLVLVDGRRVNAIDLSGVDWTQIPLDQIQRIEIVRGAGTVLYGDNAVGGVINIITKVPSKKPAFHASTAVGSYGRNTGAVSMSGGHGNMAGSLYASYDATRGYRQNSVLRSKDLGGKIVMDPTDALQLTLSGSHHSDKYGMPGSLTEAEMDENRKASYTPQDHASTIDNYVMLGMNLDLGNAGKIDADLSYRNRDAKSDFVSFLYQSDETTRTTAFTPRYVWDGSLGSHRNTLVTGMDLYWADMDVVSSSVSHVTRGSQGIYFNDEFSILKPLVLSIGARHERVGYHFREVEGSGITDRADAYTAGLTYSYLGKSSVFLRGNSSFRFPLTDELVSYGHINSALKPQKGRDYEVGIRQYLTRKMYVSVTLFRTEIHNEIFYNPITYANENYPETLHRGVEVSARAEISRFITLFGNYTYERATFEKELFHGNEIPAVPRNKANLGLSIHDFVPGLIFSATYHYVGSSYAISDQANQYEKLDRYDTVDSRLSYKWKDLQAYVGVNNIFNRKYSQYAAEYPGSPPEFYPSPERNWVAGLSVRF